jgi:hypothetical protein
MEVQSKRFNKQDLAKILIFGLFTPSESIPWSTAIAGTDYVEDNKHGWSEAKQSILNVLYGFCSQPNRSVLFRMHEDGMEQPVFDSLMKFAFTNKPLYDDPDFNKMWGHRLLEMLSIHATRLFGGEVIQVDEDSFVVTPNDNLPEEYVNVWIPFMDSYWTGPITFAAKSDIYYNHPKAIQNRILLRHSIEQVSIDNVARYLPAAHKSLAATGGMPYPQVGTKLGIISAGQLKNQDKYAYDEVMEKCRHIEFNDGDDLGGTSSHETHAYFYNQDFCMTIDDEPETLEAVKSVLALNS